MIPNERVVVSLLLNPYEWKDIGVCLVRALVSSFGYLYASWFGA